MRRLLHLALVVSASVALSCGVALALAPEHDMDFAPRPSGVGTPLLNGQGSCSYCHVPHGAASGGVRLAKTVQTGVDAVFGVLASSFCANCHLGQATYTAIGAPNGTNTMLNTTLQGARRNHPVGTVLGTLPGTVRVGPYSTSAGMECTSCHDPHTNEEVAAAAGFAQFLRAGTYESAKTPVNFCSLCHLNRTDGEAAGDHPVNLVASTYVQSQLLFGTGTNPFNRAEGDIAGGHLVAEHTDANDGVNTTETAGFVSCQTCHMPHASAQGNDTFPLFAVSGDGCSACHSDTPNGNVSQNHPVKDDPGMTGSNKNDTSGLWVRLHDYTQAFAGQHTTSTTTRWPNTGLGGTGLPLFVLSSTTPVTIVPATAAAGGQVYCSTCHGNVHVTPGDTAPAGTPLLREANNVICVNCHGQNNAYYMQNGAASGNHATLTTGHADTGATWYINPTSLTFASQWIAGGDLTGAKPAQMNGANVVCNSCHVAHGAAGIGSLNNLLNGTTDTIATGDRVLLISDNDGTTGTYSANTSQSGLCVACHAPPGTHATTVDVDITTGLSSPNLVTVVGNGQGGTRNMNLTLYPVTGTTTRSATAMRYDGTTGMYCQSCHIVHQSVANFGTFIVRETGSDSYETANGTGVVGGATEPTNWSRDPACGTRTNTTGCHNL